MNVLVVGLGSMGKRRIRLIRELFPDFEIYGVDQRNDRRVEVQDKYGIMCYATIEQVKKNQSIQCAFVCTSPLSHNGIIFECLGNNWHVFTELNLVSDGYERNMQLAKEKGCKLFLSSTFLYREEIRYIREWAKEKGRWNYIYHIGQYLPDWHPWENYKDFFVGNKRTNGCREIMAIEFPWIVSAFGEVEEVHVISDKMTELNIDYNDNYLIQIKHKNGNKGVFIADVVCPYAVRRLEVYGEHKYLQWNGTPDSLMEYNQETDELNSVVLQELGEHKEGYRSFVVENAYRNEIREFFDVVLNHKQSQYGFAQDLKVLQLIDQVEGQNE